MYGDSVVHSPLTRMCTHGVRFQLSVILVFSLVFLCQEGSVSQTFRGWHPPGSKSTQYVVHFLRRWPTFSLSGSCNVSQQGDSDLYLYYCLVSNHIRRNTEGLLDMFIYMETYLFLFLISLCSCDSNEMMFVVMHV